MKCVIETCEDPRSGKSKYCTFHKREARARWKEQIQADKQERMDRYASFEAAWTKAKEAGYLAGKACVPHPMTVVGCGFPEPAGSIVDVVKDGCCGFAWVMHRPGNDSFSQWARKNAGWSHKWNGGVQYWIHSFGQSLERKEACARAMAETLEAELPGMKFYAQSRMD